MWLERNKVTKTKINVCRFEQALMKITFSQFSISILLLFYFSMNFLRNWFLYLFILHKNIVWLRKKYFDSIEKAVYIIIRNKFIKAMSWIRWLGLYQTFSHLLFIISCFSWMLYMEISFDNNDTLFVQIG